MTDSCPTCGQAVTVHTGSEGTSSYVKVAEEARDNLRKTIDGMNEEWKAERDSLQAQLDEAREALREREAWLRRALWLVEEAAEALREGARKSVRVDTARTRLASALAVLKGENERGDPMDNIRQVAAAARRSESPSPPPTEGK